MSRALHILIALALTLSACTRDSASPPQAPLLGPGDGEGILGALKQLAVKLNFSFVGQVAERVYRAKPGADYYVVVKYTPAGAALEAMKEPISAFTEPRTFADGSMTMTRIATKELFFFTPNTSVANIPLPVVECVVNDGPPIITLSLWRVPPGTPGQPPTFRLDGISLNPSNNNKPYGPVPYGEATPSGPGVPGDDGFGSYIFRGGTLCGPATFAVDEYGCVVSGMLKNDPDGDTCVTYTNAAGTIVR